MELRQYCNVRTMNIIVHCKCTSYQECRQLHLYSQKVLPSLAVGVTPLPVEQRMQTNIDSIIVIYWTMHTHQVLASYPGPVTFPPLTAHKHIIMTCFIQCLIIEESVTFLYKYVYMFGFVWFEMKLPSVDSIVILTQRNVEPIEMANVAPSAFLSMEICTRKL